MKQEAHDERVRRLAGFLICSPPSLILDVYQNLFGGDRIGETNYRITASVAKTDRIVFEACARGRGFS